MGVWLPQKPPLKGIFVVEVLGVPGSGGRPWPAVASIGVRPTVKENAVPLLEAHLLTPAASQYRPMANSTPHTPAPALAA